MKKMSIMERIKWMRREKWKKMQAEGLLLTRRSGTLRRTGDLIEIDGYYSSLEHRTKGGTMFFEDGIFVNFSFNIDVSEEDIKTNMSKSVAGRIKNNQLQWGSWLGVYKIEGDTIIVHYYMRGSWWTPWYASEIRYKIMDRTTIQPIYWKGLLKMDEQYYKKDNKSPWIDNGDKYIFFSR